MRFGELSAAIACEYEQGVAHLRKPPNSSSCGSSSSTTTTTTTITIAVATMRSLFFRTSGS